MSTDTASPREPARQPVGNQPGGPSGAGIEQRDGSRGNRSGLNVDQERAIGVPPRPVAAEDAGQEPDASRDSTSVPTKGDSDVR